MLYSATLGLILLQQQVMFDYACRYSAGEQAYILFSVGISDASELSSLMQRLNDKDMPTQDLSGIEAAQVMQHFTLLANFSCSSAITPFISCTCHGMW